MVTNENAKCDPYDCDGAQKTFTITIPFHAASDIEVRIKSDTTGVVTKLTNPTHFSVDNANVVTVAAYSSDYKLYIKRATPQTQGTDLNSLGPSLWEETERALDRLTLEVQEMKEKLSRTAFFDPASDESDHALPEPENEYFLRWREGMLVNAKAFGGGVYAIQSYMKTILESIDKATARTNLDVYGKTDDRPAVDVSLADADGRYTAAEVEAALAEIAGAGRTTETVKGNAGDIASNLSLLNAYRNIKVVNEADYTILDDDGYAVILVTAGASDRTITYPTASANTERQILVVKVDSGVGEVILDGEGAETIEGFVTLRLINQYDFLHTVCDGSGHLRIAGAIALVSGEPSLGTGHWRGDSSTAALRLDQNTAVASTWYDVTFPNAPEGAKCAYAFTTISSGAASIKVAYIRKNGDTVAIGYQLLQMWGENIYNMGVLCKFPLDGSKISEIATNGIYRIRVYEAVFYDI